MNDSLSEMQEFEVKEASIDFTKEPYMIREEILALPSKEQDFWIAMWITQPIVLEDMRYRPLPAKPSKMAKDEEIKREIAQRESIKAQNWRNLKELKWAKSILKDEYLIQKIDEKINGFIDIEELPEQNNQKQDHHWQD